MVGLIRIAQVVWLITLAGLLLVYADTPLRTFSGRRFRYVRVATRARLLLGAVEIVLLAGAVALDRLGTIDLAIRRGPFAWLPLTGAAASLTGAGIASWAKWRLGSLFTANLAVKEGHLLVTDGPFAIVRHPIYLGIVLFALGTGAVWNSYAYLTLGIALIPCFWLQLRVEEGLFLEHFGDAYREYRRRVPALVPWPRRRG